MDCHVITELNILSSQCIAAASQCKTITCGAFCSPDLKERGKRVEVKTYNAVK